MTVWVRAREGGRLQRTVRVEEEGEGREGKGDG